MATVARRVRILQDRLGLRPDGVIGPDTLTRLESIVEEALGPAPTSEALLVASKKSLDLIVRSEITSEANYRQRLSQPTWPGAGSGVTIGIGYDLGATSRSRIEKDWRGRIRDAELERLLETQGVQGNPAATLIAGLSDIHVPLVEAKEVFYRSSLPTYARKVRRIYPGVEDLPGDAQGALLSLVFNRGASLSGGRRREMKAIVDLASAGDLAGIAREIRSMKRLWVGLGLDGLLKRRDKEATLVARAEREYESAELVRI